MNYPVAWNDHNINPEYVYLIGKHFKATIVHDAWIAVLDQWLYEQLDGDIMKLHYFLPKGAIMMNIDEVSKMMKEYEKLIIKEKKLKTLLNNNLCSPKLEARVLGYCSYNESVIIDDDIFKKSLEVQLDRVSLRLSEIKK